MAKRSTVLLAVSLMVGVGLDTSPQATDSAFAHDSAQQLLRKAVAALRSARGVHVDFTAKTPSATLGLDADVFRNGDVNGVISLGGYPSRLVVFGGTAYEKINPAILEQLLNMPAQQAQQLSNEWVAGPNSSTNGAGANAHYAVGTSFSFAELEKIFGQSFGVVTAAGTSKIGRQRVLRLHSSQHATLWIASTGTPYPQELSASTTNGSITITMSKWNRPHPPSAPKSAVPISSLSFTGDS